MTSEISLSVFFSDRSRYQKLVKLIIQERFRNFVSSFLFYWFSHKPTYVLDSLEIRQKMHLGDTRSAFLSSSFWHARFSLLARLARSSWYICCASSAGRSARRLGVFRSRAKRTVRAPSAFAAPWFPNKIWSLLTISLVKRMLFGNTYVHQTCNISAAKNAHQRQKLHGLTSHTAIKNLYEKDLLKRRQRRNSRNCKMILKVTVQKNGLLRWESCTQISKDGGSFLHAGIGRGMPPRPMAFDSPTSSGLIRASNWALFLAERSTCFVTHFQFTRSLVFTLGNSSS